MKTSTIPLLETIVRFCIRRRLPLGIITTVMAIWLIGGMVILPYMLERFLTKQWAVQTGRPVTVSDIRFHPWHWALTLEQFRIADSDGTTLVSFDSLLVDYDMLSLFRLEFGLDAIEWQKPYVKLAMDENGVPGIQSLAPPANPAAPPPQPVAIPSVWIKHIAIQQLVVDYQDSHRVKPFAVQFDPVSFTLDDFHTRDAAHHNRIDLQASIAGSGQLGWEGQVRLEPLRVDGKLLLKNIALLQVLDFVLPERTFVLQSALLDVELPHHIEMNGKLSATVQQARVAVRDVRIAAEGQVEPFVSLPSIIVDGIDVDLQTQAVNIHSVQLTDGKIHVVQDAERKLNVQQLAAAPETTLAPAVAPDPVVQSIESQSTVPQSTVTQPAAAPPWQIAIAELALDNYALTVTDQTLSPAVEIALAPIRFHATGIRPLAAEPMTFQLSVGLPEASELAVQGTAVVKPLQLSADVQLKQLPLALAQPYVAQQARVVIGNGTLEAALKVAVAQQDALQVAVSGTSAIRDLDIHEKTSQRKVVSWRALELAGIDYALVSNALTVSGITVDKPYGRFIINADGTTNIQQLLVPQPAAPAPVNNVETATPSAMSARPPFVLAVNQVAVQDGDMGFADMTLKPDFRVAMEKLNGTISNITTDPAVMAKIDLKGKVDRYAPATIHGTFNVLGKTPALDMAVGFKNIELTTFTPYSGTYAGFVIDKGQISVDLDYQLVENRIAGKNRIVMNQLQLGEHVENEKAMDLPIRLALALLRDENGVIDLGFEVNGNVDEPSFSIGGLLLKVLGNLVMKAVTAPFSLFSDMANVPEQSDHVAFAYGSATLDELGASKVAAVAALLQKRGMVHVTVRGNVLPDEDRFALQQQRLAEQMGSESGLPPEQFLSPALAVEAGAPRRLVGRQLHALRNEELGDLEDRILEDLRARQQPEDKTAVRIAAYEQAWRRLAETVSVQDADLKQLAMARASQIKTVLMEKHGIPPGRVFVLDAANGDSTPEAVAVLGLGAD